MALLRSGLGSRCCEAKKPLLRSMKLSGELLPPELPLPAECPPSVWPADERAVCGALAGSEPALEGLGSSSSGSGGFSCTYTGGLGV